MEVEGFPIFGSNPVPMLGRKGITERIIQELTKRTPVNLSIVGPRYMGKSVIMKSIAEKFQIAESPFRSVLNLHLGHETFQSDGDFISFFCSSLQKELERSASVADGYRDYIDSGDFPSLKEVTDAMDAEGKAILVLLDAFDTPLVRGRLSGDLWTMFRTLFHGKTHKIVCATRAPLRELIRENASSEFWRIFDQNTLRVAPFGEEDMREIIDGLTRYHFKQGALSELINWTGGQPVFFLSLLNSLCRKIPEGAITNDLVNEAAKEETYLCVRGYIEDVWNECSVSLQDAYKLIKEAGPTSSGIIGKSSTALLLEKGFIREEKGKYVPSFRFLDSFLDETHQSGDVLKRFFHDWDGYRKNIRYILERRLAQVPVFDERLHRLITHAVETFPKFPEDSLNEISHICGCALDLIWNAEFGPDRKVPASLLETVSEKTVPTERGAQCSLLEKLTGSKQDVIRTAKYVSKDVYQLVSFLHKYRNRKEHAGGEPIDPGVTVSVLMVCIELYACLQRELPIYNS